MEKKDKVFADMVNVNYPTMDYVFEPVAGRIETYQVRLKGFFVCYSNHKSPQGIDEALHEMGYESREDFLEEMIDKGY